MVDILMATYNGEKYLRDQIESILHQTYQEFRIIVRDDGSKDNTIDIIEEYVSQYPQKINLVKDDVKCGSSASNFMELCKHSASEYVMYCDQDDVWLPNKIEVSLNAIKQVEKKVGREKPILVFAKYKVVDKNLNEIKDCEKSSQIYKCNTNLNALIVQNCVTGCLTIVNKALNELMGEYDKDILMHDWWAALIASAMGSIVNIPDVVMYYRQHGDNVVGSVNVTSAQYRITKLFDKNVRNSSYMYRKQMVLFLNRYGDKLGENKKIVNDFIELFDKPKIFRILLLIKNGYLKSDLIRVIGQIIYI